MSRVPGFSWFLIVAGVVICAINAGSYHETGGYVLGVLAVVAGIAMAFVANRGPRGL